MEASWLAVHWLDLLQSIGIIGGLLLTSYVAWKDTEARRVANSIAINEQYRQIWRELYDHPELSRVLQKRVDLKQEPISLSEELFVTTLILHLGTVVRATKRGEFVQLEGLRKDVKEFFALTIPRNIWGKIKAFQDSEFVAFIDDCLDLH